MDAIFLKLLNMSISAGWLILAVIVIRLLLKKAPKWISCLLWAIVAVRLLCPFSIESTLSLIPSAEILSPAVVQYAQEPEIDTGVTFINSAVNPMMGESFAPAPGDSVNPLQIWMYVAGILWAVGLSIMLVYAFLGYCRIRRTVQEAIPLQDNIWLCDAVASPFILGIVRPRIYLPSGMDEEQMKYVLVHEEAHLKRKDHWWKPLGYLLLAVYWFHPLVWIAYGLLCRDIEIACDEKVIKDMDMSGKKAYSDALVSCSMQRRMIAACPLAFGEVGVKERVKTVLHYKKPAFWVILVSVAVCVVIAVCFLTNPKRDTFDVKIVVPAGGESGFYFSEEEISPDKNRITLFSGEGLGDTEVVLQPIEFREENAYEPTYMTPGMPVKMDVEKGAWFRVGVHIGNPTNEDMVAYVRVKGVDVRISDYAVNEIEMDGEDKIDQNSQHGELIQYLGNWYPKADLSDDTIEWLNWYNSLPEDEQLKVDHVPSDLYELAGYGNDSETAAETYDASYTDENTITFTGIIVDHTLELLEPHIMIEPFGDEIPYERICLILPENEMDWMARVDSVVSITCKDSFEETLPPFGEAISISGIGDTPMIREGGISAAISAAIFEKNASAPSYTGSSKSAFCDFYLLGKSTFDSDEDAKVRTITYYGWSLYQEYSVSEKGIRDISGSHIPVALTFELSENGYELKEYWEPRDGSFFVSDIRDKFPERLAEDGIDSQKFILPQIQSCYRQAVEANHLQTDTVIENLLDTICSDPAASSNPQDYIDAHPIEYRELMYYDKYTIRYCLNRFQNGKETGLDGKIMAIACEELLQTKGTIPADAYTAETGQFWFDTLLAHAGNLVEPYFETE